MKFLLLSFNPAFVREEELRRIVQFIEDDQKLKVYIIPHLNDNFDPVYCVQFVDTTKVKDNA